MFWIAMAVAIAERVKGDELGDHTAHDLQMHERLYSNWTMPDNPGVSCCNVQDCAPVEQIRVRNGKLEALRSHDQKWLIIPPGKVEQDRDSPDGRSHMCSRFGSSEV